jgi:phosphoribosylformylglycinamidine synthase subunit PurQ / glutaminase
MPPRPRPLDAPAPGPRAPRLALVRLPGAGGVDPQLPAALTAAWGDEALSLHEGGGPLHADAALVVDGCGGGADDGAGLTGVTLRAFAAAGGPVLGVGAGFGALCAAGLLPGRVAATLAGETPPTHVRVEGRPTPFTWAIPAGRVLGIGREPLGARYLPPDPEALVRAGRVVLRYCDGAGGLADGDSVAGVCDDTGRVVGLFPGSLAVASALAPGLGRQLLACLRLALQARR